MAFSLYHHHYSTTIPYFFLILLLCITALGCSKEDSPEAAPTSPVAGRWDLKTQQSTFFDADGGIIWDRNFTGDGTDYYVLTADNRFEFYQANTRKSNGTYKYENGTLTIVGVQTTTYTVKSVTPTTLSLTGDARTNKAGMYYQWEYVKH